MIFALPLNSQLYGYATAAGSLSHWTYFVHGEHHLSAPRLLRLALASPILTCLSLWRFGSLNPIEAGILTAGLAVSYISGLWISILIYRIFFHRLKSFPGPFMAKISKLWHVFKLAPKSDNFRQLDKLHKQYGDYVRTGPGEISIFDPEAIPILLGPGSKCTKAPWYDANYPVISLHTLRDKKEHDERRRIWDRGFGVKALRSYEDRVHGFSKLLEQQIAMQSGQVINATEWFHFYSFDVMADIAFGKSFGMIQNGKPHFAFDLLREGMRPLGVLGPVPWAFCTLTSIPGLGSGFKTFVNWCTEQVEKRKKMQLKTPDVMSWLIESSQKHGIGGSKTAVEREQSLLHSDSRLVIVAGSDTTASTLTYIFYLLAKNVIHQQKLRQELDSIIESNGPLTFKGLQSADHLNGVINEALRLHPAVPSGVLRMTPPEGLTIGKTLIPGNTTVTVPSYTTGRLESCYENPDEFIPERWYSKPDFVKNKKAFAPFSLGPYACVGKQLALMELRMTVALLTVGFSFKFAPGENGERLMNDSKDFFTVSTAGLDLIFSPTGRSG